jgi:hypothetical protein
MWARKNFAISGQNVEELLKILQKKLDTTWYLHISKVKKQQKQLQKQREEQ